MNDYSSASFPWPPRSVGAHHGNLRLRKPADVVSGPVLHTKAKKEAVRRGHQTLRQPGTWGNKPLIMWCSLVFFFWSSRPGIAWQTCARASQIVNIFSFKGPGYSLNSSVAGQKWPQITRRWLGMVRFQYITYGHWNLNFMSLVLPHSKSSRCKALSRLMHLAHGL